MRVLVLSQFYKPEPISKPHELAEGLQKRGHDVTVVTGFPNYPYGKFYDGYRLPIPKTETIEGVRVIRLPLFPDHSRSAAMRIINYGSFCLSASTLGMVLASRADVMYVWHPPLTVGVAAVTISKIRRIPFLYAVHDLWPESVSASGILRNKSLINFLKNMERFIYGHATVIGISSPGFEPHMLTNEVPSEKIRLLPDWADEEIYKPVPPEAHLREKLGFGGKFNVIFGGQFGIAQDLESVINAWELLKTHENIQLVLVGDGVEKNKLEKIVAEKGLTNIKFLGRFQPEEMASIYALADVLLVHLSSESIFESSIPGKTYSYMACGKPILMAAKGAAAKIIDDSSAGLSVPPSQPELLARSVVQFFNMSNKDREKMGQNALELFQSKYSKTRGVDMHEKVLTEIASLKKRLGLRRISA